VPSYVINGVLSYCGRPDLWQFDAFIVPANAALFPLSRRDGVGRRLRHYVASEFATIGSQSASVIFHKPRLLHVGAHSRSAEDDGGGEAMRRRLAGAGLRSGGRVDGGAVTLPCES